LPRGRSGLCGPGPLCGSSPGPLRGSGRLRVLRSGLWRDLLQDQVPPQAALPKLLPDRELLLGPGALRSVRCGPGPLRRSVRRSGLLRSALPRELLQVQVQVP
jgi:hypothetical protein